MNVQDLDDLLGLAQKSRGWVFREYPPQRAHLRGNCELIVIPPWLWRGRCRPRPASTGELVSFHKRVA